MSAHWARPHWTPSRRQAQLFYLVVGPPPVEPALSRSRHHVDAIEPELDVRAHRREDAPEWFAGWFDGPIATSLDGVFGPAAGDVRAAGALTTVRGVFDDRDSLDYVRNTIGVVSAIAEAGAIALFDAVALTWWRPAMWQECFVARSEFRIAEQIQVIASDDPEFRPGLWMHTRGMAKFARPEVQVKHVPDETRALGPATRKAGQLVNRIAEHLALGAVIRDGQTMGFPGMQSKVVFIETPDDSEGLRHFNNAALEVVDLDPETGYPAPGIGRLLREMG